METFRRYYGPTFKALGTLDEKGQAVLRQELEQHWADHNNSGNGVTRVESEYLEVVATRAE